mgnify:CR=1 FL=1
MKDVEVKEALFNEEEKETEEEVKKALEDSLGSMTIEEAEDIIFS